MDRIAAYNTGFASGGVTCKVGALCFYFSSVLVDSFVLRNPPEREARKRQAVKKPNSNLFLQKNTPTIFLDFTSACLP